MVAVDIGEVQALIGDFNDHLRGFSTQDNPPLAGEVGPGYRQGADVVKRGLIDVRRFVPVSEVPPRVQHVVVHEARDKRRHEGL